MGLNYIVDEKDLELIPENDSEIDDGLDTCSYCGGK